MLLIPFHCLHFLSCSNYCHWLARYALLTLLFSFRAHVNIMSLVCALRVVDSLALFMLMCAAGSPTFFSYSGSHIMSLVCAIWCSCSHFTLTSCSHVTLTLLLSCSGSHRVAWSSLVLEGPVWLCKANARAPVRVPWSKGTSLCIVYEAYSRYKNPKPFFFFVCTMDETSELLAFKFIIGPCSRCLIVFEYLDRKVVVHCYEAFFRYKQYKAIFKLNFKCTHWAAFFVA